MTTPNSKFMDLLTASKAAQALGFAIAKPGDKKYGDEPYLTHLLRVAETVYQLGQGFIPTVDLISAALLHDTLEDTDTTEGELSGTFGPEVAKIVAACTKAEEDGPKELHAC